jgi:hypothetical protein
MKQLTKKDLAMSMHTSGRSVEDIAQTLKCSPSYVANILAASGKSSDYSDLYTSSVVQNAYARMFSGVLRFKNVEAARESVARIDELFHQFAAERDRRGQHQAQLMALIGKNRAEGIGKSAEAKIFLDWLLAHLDTAQAPACDLQGSFEGMDDDTAAHSEYAEMSPYEATLAYA